MVTIFVTMWVVHVELFDPTTQQVKDGKIGGHICFQDEESFQMSYRTYL